MRGRTTYVRLVIRAIWELICYDLIYAVSGFRQVYRQVERQRVVRRAWEPARGSDSRRQPYERAWPPTAPRGFGAQV